MNPILNWINGKKTFLAALFALIVALMELLGIDVTPSLDQTTALNAVWAALIAMFLRSAVTGEARKSQAMVSHAIVATADEVASVAATKAVSGVMTNLGTLDRSRQR